jgi:1-acyl-sn-glycerol-3-phosphate acyltransferase
VPSPIWGVPLRLLICVVVAAYVRLAYRVHLEGRLPRQRGATLVVSNHQHDLEGMVLPVWLTLAGPWRHPVYCAASQRLFEPGFLAFRGPAWLRPLLYRLNLGPLFRQIGVLPIENQPLAKPLAAYAYAVRRRHGNRTLAEVFEPAVRERLRLPGDVRLDDLWGIRLAKAARTRVTYRSLRNPYREEARAAVRDEIDAQLADIRRVLASGRTLYLTPEGRYSQDGHMMRFRQSFYELSPLADALYGVSISYDPFVRRRLTLYARIFELPRHAAASRRAVQFHPSAYHQRTQPDVLLEGEDVVTRIAAGRPITVSQLLCEWLLKPSSPKVFSEADAVKAVRAAVEALPPYAALAPELAVNFRRAIRAVILNLVRHGALERVDSDHFQLGARRTHPAFPDVPDIVEFQANMLHETLAALAVCGKSTAAKVCSPVSHYQEESNDKTNPRVYQASPTTASVCSVCRAGGAGTTEPDIDSSAPGRQ